ncbi:amidohydrolase family protein [Granulosicoccus sp. 3-233]|uniref:metal-dependent hydrolase family protein n=1 Tax=Granulosicoccus sp. 3-233 TaxID=3417969 RepID=UPI003D32D6B9
MSGYSIINACVWDASVNEPFAATVDIDDNRITAVTAVNQPDQPDTATPPGGRIVIDGQGMTLMPGMVEGHCHPSFTNVNLPSELGQISPEEHMLLTAANLKLLLDHGFTSIFEAASAKPLLGVTARNAINSGLIPGPRMRAGSPEIGTTAGLGDERKRHLYQESFGLSADGPDEMRKVARECVRDGVDTLKINISGDEFVSHARAEITPLEEEELAAFVRVARTFEKTTAAHARSPKSVKMAVKHGIDCIYHCDFADEEALDQLESVKDRIFVGPAFGLVHNSTREGSPHGLTPEVCEQMDLYRKFDACCASYHEIRKRGIRVVIGGDYGFAVTPMGQNARDIEHFTKWFGYSNQEALSCATVIGAQLMGLADSIGYIRPGFLADLLLVKGDPTRDVSLLQSRDRLALIMKDGVVYKNATMSEAAS